MLLGILLGYLIYVGNVICKGGVKCITCPPCMICDPLVGCTYDNFAKCTSNKLSGYCINGSCNTTIGNLKILKPPVCKTYSIVNNSVNGINKTIVKTIDDINGLSCTKVGAILESVCIKGVCTPYTLGVDRLGQPTGCVGLPDGFLCDTNMVFTDGEKCVNQKCVMPDNPQNLCLL